MKRFWLKILLLVPLPLIVVGFTWFVDPVHLRNADQYEYGIARLILDGKRVTNISNPNEAAYIKFVVDGLKTRKDVLVLGSSRSKLLRSDSFAGRPSSTTVSPVAASSTIWPFTTCTGRKG